MVISAAGEYIPALQVFIGNFHIGCWYNREQARHGAKEIALFD